MNTQDTVTIDRAELDALDGEIIKMWALLKALAEAVTNGNNDSIALSDLAQERLHRIDCISCRIRGEREPEAPDGITG